MRRGTELIAAAPTGWSRPGFVTRPTPAPPSMATPGSGLRETRATMNIPPVTSASSPESLTTAHSAASPSLRQKSGSTSTVRPFGVSRARTAGAVPLRSSRAAPAAARAAQVPVV